MTVLITGIDFIRKHLDSILEEENAHMPIGFELVFPSMVGEAKTMGLDLPYDSPLMKVVCDEMEKKLQRSGLATLFIVHAYFICLQYKL